MADYAPEEPEATRRNRTEYQLTVAIDPPPEASRRRATGFDADTEVGSVAPTYLVDASGAKTMDKQALRERVWDDLEASGEARFPFPPHGRIPNFAGAEEAAERLARTDVWEDARVIKSNPDAPQRPVRRRALEAGKTVYMAVPRLREEKCFLRLDPAEIEDIDHATTIRGSSEVGEQVGPEEMEPVDLVVSGSVAVNIRGARVGKGEGYSDLEFAILRESGLVDDDTLTVSTVHEIQVVDEDVLTTPHDVPMDWVFTPERDIRTEVSGSKPRGIAWDELDEDRLEEIPILQGLNQR